MKPRPPSHPRTPSRPDFMLVPINFPITSPFVIAPIQPKAKRAPPPLKLKKETTTTVLAVGDVDDKESVTSHASSKLDTKHQLSPLPPHVAPPIPTPFTAHPAKTTFTRPMAPTPHTASAFKTSFGSKSQAASSSFSKIFPSSASIKSASSKGSKTSKLSRLRSSKFALPFPLPPSVTTQVDTPTASAFKPSPALNALNNTAQATGTYTRKRGASLLVSTTANIASAIASPQTPGPPPATPHGRSKSFFSSFLRRGSFSQHTHPSNQSSSSGHR
ncbi:hypothetical protein BT69DRAFT_409679 [Atractiella rhizophila]|nr:hypothetical protein BT69DRAFT_409679 [Atractiella rhizophila]